MDASSTATVDQNSMSSLCAHVGRHSRPVCHLDGVRMVDIALTLFDLQAACHCDTVLAVIHLTTVQTHWVIASWYEVDICNEHK